MNLKLTIPSVLLAAMVISCVQPHEVDTCKEENVITLTASQGQTKTVLGEPAGDKVPVYWSSGDRINVNGTVSSPLIIGDGQKVSKADFKVSNVALPYSVVYPAEAYSGADENGMIQLTIPQTQKYVPGSFASGADILFGTAVAEGEVQMNHLCATVKLSLTDAQNSTIRKMSLRSSSEAHPIAGTFCLDPENLTLSPKEGVSSITMALPEEGVSLDSEAVDFYLTIPAGDYPDGFTIVLEDDQKHIQRFHWLRNAPDAAPGVTVTAGSLIQFASSEYDPGAREICSVDDWELFVAAYNAGGDAWKSDWLGKDGVIRLGADISAKSVSQIISLSYPIDGCGFSITQTEGHSPLIGTNRAEVSNLTLKGKMIPADPFTAGAAVFTTTLGSAGKFINCHNEMDVTVNAIESSEVVAGCFVRSMQGGLISNCTNSGDIAIYSNINLKKDQRVLAGGFVAIVRDLTGPATIEGCVNNGDVSVLMEKVAGAADKRPINAGYAGIVANVTYGTASTYLTIKDCVNNGNISVSYTPDPTSAQHLVSGVGGILGLSTKLTDTGAGYYSINGDSFYLVLDGCVNNGNLENRLVSPGDSQDLNKAFAGGVAGVIHGLKASHAKVVDCSSFGKVTSYEGTEYTRAGLCTCAGGLIGCGAFIDMEGCIVNSPSVGTLKRQSYAVSAGVATLHQSFTMTNCRFFANLNIIRSKTYAENNWSLGFSLSTAAAGGNTKYATLEGSSVTGCSFGGTLTTNKDVVEFSSKATTFGDMETKTFTASDCQNHIASKSYGENKVTFENNSYWDGNLTQTL